MTAGRFISLEGIEGAGKSTLARALQAELERRAVPALFTREPGGTPVAESLRAVLLEPGRERISPLAETLLMFAARAVHLDNAIRPALASGRWVICDRYTDASFAYQGAGRGVDERLLEELSGAVHGGMWPERTLLLDLPVTAGLARARARPGSPDRFEGEQVHFFERVREAYLKRAAREPERIKVIDAAQPAAQLAAAAILALEDLWPAGEDR